MAVEPLTMVRQTETREMHFAVGLGVDAVGAAGNANIEVIYYFS